MNVPMSGGQGLALPGRALDQLLPMHLWFDSTGRVMRAGPTLIKLLGEAPLGRDVFDVIAMRRPRMLATLSGLLALDGQRLSLSLRCRPGLILRGQVQALPAGAGGLINFSLGLSFAEAVEDCGLTLSDFSPCDQTVDLLYLREAIRAISVESRRLTNRLIAAERAAEARATTDALTGLANRRALMTLLDKVIGQEGMTFALMNIDLDYFKQINDRLGHAAGDEVLMRVAAVLTDEIREKDLAARVGGDEFVLVIRDCVDPAILGRIADRVTARLSEPMEIEGERCQIGASVGITRSTLYSAPDPERMLRDADVALYASKHAGRGGHSLFAPDPGADRVDAGPAR